MKKSSLYCIAIAVSIVFLLPLTALGDEGTPWGYEEPAGPDQWADLSADFHLCGSGKNQSPIDLSAFIDSRLEPMTYEDRAVDITMHNNGHTIQVEMEPGNNITMAGQAFELKQFHFHAPSEHTLDGRSFPMEVHLVHADKDGNMLVIAVLLEEGRTNRVMKELWRQIPATPGRPTSLRRFRPYEILPDTRTYYRYNGSLTTPPCTEGVRWIVMRVLGEVSRRQADVFMGIMKHANNRPVQPVNARPVLQ